MIAIFKRTTLGHDRFGDGHEWFGAGNEKVREGHGFNRAAQRRKDVGFSP